MRSCRRRTLCIGLLLYLWSPQVLTATPGQKTAKADTEALSSALRRFRFEFDRYPSQDEGLRALIVRPPGGVGHYSGPFLDEVPLDPWGNEYVYVYPGEHNPNSFDIFSCGPDAFSKR